MSSSSSDNANILKRRLERERSARQQSEAIAERVTAELYQTTLALKRTNEELQAVNQSMRDFVAIASHDFRSPLTSILGFSGMLLSRWDTLGDEQRVEYIDVIKRQGEHLKRLVDDLLTVSTIEAGALDVHQEVVTLHDALRRAIDDFAQTAAQVELVAPDGLAVMVDPNHLNRILMNFVTNAVKYGEPPVEVKAVDCGDCVEIRVCDHGEGVPEAFVPRLFARFARADTEATRDQKGTGLGLSIVQGLARANGGETWYEPNSPHGSCFAVRLPKPAA
jgi:signal transduction histidine kinase